MLKNGEADPSKLSPGPPAPTLTQACGLRPCSLKPERKPNVLPLTALYSLQSLLLPFGLPCGPWNNPVGGQGGEYESHFTNVATEAQRTQS